MTVLKVKSGAGGTWEEVGGVGIGVPAGGTTGQVLTKTSAADYATAWSSTPAILPNNTYLQGYRVDGTTAVSLIGVSTAGDIHLGLNFPGGSTIYLGYGTQGDMKIGENMAAGKNIYVPRLTVQGSLTVVSNDYGIVTAAGAQVIYHDVGSGALHFGLNTNTIFNQTSGGSSFVRNVEITGTLTKGGVAYTHPDFVFEHAYTGQVEKFIDAPGAKDYEGLMPLSAVEAHTREHWCLPHQERDGKYDLFRRGDEVLAEVERLYLYMFEHEKRLKALEAR